MFGMFGIFLMLIMDFYRFYCYSYLSETTPGNNVVMVILFVTKNNIAVEKETLRTQFYNFLYRQSGKWRAWWIVELDFTD